MGARHQEQIILASPLAPAYPEWSETNDAIALRDAVLLASVSHLLSGIQKAITWQPPRLETFCTGRAAALQQSSGLRC